MLLAIPLVEVSGSLVIQARVPSEGDWEAVAERVRAAHRPGDLVVVTPFWADPLLRLHLGDVLSFADAGHHDLAPYDRLWVVSIEGLRHEQEPKGAPALSEHYGEITLRRHDLGPSPVVYDFIAHLDRAEVSVTRDGARRSCPLRRGVPRGGSGLFQGPMQPAERFVCDLRVAWSWVGATELEDLALRPRWCIWQHPVGPEPVTVTFHDVPLGDELVLYAGLYWDDERYRRGAPVRLVIRVDGEEVGTLHHADGDGFKRLVAQTGRGRDGVARRGEVSFSVTAADARGRSLCWAATTRTGERAEDP